MKALVIGGTGFLGGAIVEAVLNSGYSVDVLTRQELGSSQEGLRFITGDRYKALDLPQTYDFIFDTCGFEPEGIQNILKRINKDQLKKYVFISSVSVYSDYSTPKLSESTRLVGAKKEDLDLASGIPHSERTSAYSYGGSYGPLKRECEKILELELGCKAVLLRAGLLVGKGDYTDRFTWWVRRID